jgi:bla regulator protein blaR1
MMPVLLTKITLLFIAALIALLPAKRLTAATRHLLGIFALAGSLLLPLTMLAPARIVTIHLPAIEAVASSQAVARAESWSSSTVLFSLWAFGCTALVLRLAIGHWRISRLIRAATPAGSHDLYLADVNVPIACGLLRPAILMPRSSVEWPGWQFDAAVRHERMHVRRKDLWANFVAQLACAVWWFHPLVWALSRQLHACQETACDDAVLFSGFEPATYAEALLSVAQAMSQTPTSNLLQGCPMTAQTNLKTRIARLLDRGIARTTSRANLLRTAIGFAVVLIAIGTVGLQNSRAQADRVYKVGGDVTAPRPLSRVDPTYTKEAYHDKIEGTVLLGVVIETDGLAHDISVIKSLDPGLDRAAAEAIQQWHFAPGTRQGEPVAVRATIEVNFKLK